MLLPAWAYSMLCWSHAAKPWQLAQGVPSGDQATFHTLSVWPSSTCTAESSAICGVQEHVQLPCERLSRQRLLLQHELHCVGVSQGKRHGLPQIWLRCQWAFRVAATRFASAKFALETSMHAQYMHVASDTKLQTCHAVQQMLDAETTHHATIGVSSFRGNCIKSIHYNFAHGHFQQDAR